MTVAVLLVHSGLSHHAGSTTTVSTRSVADLTTGRTTTRAKATAAKRYYTVQSGDTFGTIAARVGIPVDRLQQLNPGVSSNALRVGQRLRVK